MSNRKYFRLNFLANRTMETAAYSWVEDIDGLDRSFAFLLEPKHQVDPLAQRLGDLVRLQRLAVDQDEESRVVSGPGGQIDVVHPLAILTNTEIKPWGSKKII